MKRKMKNIKKTVLLSLTAIISTLNLLAQPENPCPDPLDPCPIDNGVLFLIAVVMLVAIKKIVDAKRNMVV